MTTGPDRPDDPMAPGSPDAPAAPASVPEKPGDEAVADATEAGDAPVVAAAGPAVGGGEPAGAGSPARLRCFVAFSLPIAATRRVAEEALALKKEAARTGARVAWVPAANLHVTLKFLGSVAAPAVEAVRDAIRSAAATLPPFEAEGRGFGAFPSRERARVLWAGVPPTPAIAALQQRVEAAMIALGFAPEERAFHPHITVGRVSAGDPALGPLLAAREAVVMGGGRVTEVVLYESRVLRTGAEYHALARLPLGRESLPASQTKST